MNIFWKAFLILACIAFSSCFKVSDFETSILKPSHPSGYYNVMTGDDIIGEILCFGDINSDQYTDYLATPNRQSRDLIVYFWNYQKSQFLKSGLQIPSSAFEENVHTVEQAMLTDLTQDGTDEIIVVVSQDNDENATAETSGYEKIYRVLVYEVSQCGWSSCVYKFIQIEGGALDSMTAPPTLINLDGEGSPNFLTFQGTNRFIVKKSSKGDVLKYTKTDFADFLNNQQKPTHFNSVSHHFTSNIDFTGDCHSDLVILSRSDSQKSVLEFYEKQTNSKFHFATTLKFQKEILFYTFVDLDSSGTVDIALIAKNEVGEAQLYFIESRRDPPEELCDDSGPFPYEVANMKSYKLGYSLANNTVLHFGDVNSDSFPDLLAIVKMRDFRNAVLFKNSKGKDDERVFKKAEDLNADQIQQIKNPQQVAFFDLAEDGKLDMLIMGADVRDSDGSSVITRTAIMNNVKDDTLFIKILPLSQSSKYTIDSATLSSAFGITIQWTITQLSGEKKIELLNQRTQWNHGTLQLPFACGGLGRTNNYVEDLTVGYEGVGKAQSWSPIIPNSKLLVYRDKEDGVWKLQTLLTNSERVNQVIYVSIAILLALGFVIFFLNYREKKEDRKDQYNFIQLIR